ncbi:MAG: hypothetical protein Q4G08_09315 [Capnocytophaga sp.]|nr:hypothetical protein [Capnocytophaga sp.]
MSLLSCNSKKLELPRVSGATHTEMLDYSTIYVFYNADNQKAGLNQNNLITSTHWVFHVDRRLSLSEAGAMIVKMQDKKEKPGPHDNPNSRNFFSVADMDNQELRFVDFTKTRFRILPESSADIRLLANDDLESEANRLIDSNETPEKIYLDATVNFEKMLVFLQKIQSAGVYINEIYIKP